MKVPNIGSKIRVTVRHRNYSYYDSSEWRNNTFVGEVVQNDRWVDGSSFCLRTDNPQYPVSIISIKNVVDISIISGKMSNVRKFRVKGTNEYIVTLSGKHFSCECIGFKYHSKCRHITKVKDKLGTV